MIPNYISKDMFEEFKFIIDEIEKEQNATDILTLMWHQIPKERLKDKGLVLLVSKTIYKKFIKEIKENFERVGQEFKKPKKNEVLYFRGVKVKSKL